MKLTVLGRSAVLVLFTLGSCRGAEEPPVIPVGLDAYRQWERWPYQRIGARAYMRSTYDRRGGNEGADASHFLYQLADDFNVSLDVEGPGILYFARYNHWHGSPWHYEIDGVDHIVQETSTANPNQPTAGSVFLPNASFPHPLTWTWSLTKGADLSWVPILFEKSFRMAYGRARLRVTWDDSPHPSIDTPVALFFGAGTLSNRDNREYLVKAFPVHIRFGADEVHLACFFPMPFFKSARIQLLNPTDTPLTVRWSARYAPFKDDPANVAYFHATYRDHPEPEPGQDLILLNTAEVEGGGDWSGHFVGTSFIF